MSKTLPHSYWGHDGKYQSLYEEMKGLEPQSGEADDPMVELLRCVGNVYYDCYNNGGCNLDVLSEQLDMIHHYRIPITKMMGPESRAWDNYQATVICHRQQLENPEVQEDEVDCFECGGSCTEDCPECGGERDCEHCNSSGQVDCSNCDGYGTETETFEEVYPYLSQSCGDAWMQPLEDILDAVIQMVYFDQQTKKRTASVEATN